MATVLMATLQSVPGELVTDPARTEASAIEDAELAFSPSIRSVFSDHLTMELMARGRFITLHLVTVLARRSLGSSWGSDGA